MTAEFDFRSWTCGKQVTIGPFTVEPFRSWTTRSRPTGCGSAATARCWPTPATRAAATRWTRLADGADLLLAEASFRDGDDNPREHPPDRQRLRRPGRVRRGSGGWCSPTSRRGSTRQDMLAEAQAVWDGPAELARPGAVYDAGLSAGQTSPASWTQIAICTRLVTWSLSKSRETCAFTVGTDRCSSRAISALVRPRPTAQGDVLLAVGRARASRRWADLGAVVAGVVAEPVDEGPGHRRGEHRVAVGHRPDRLEDLRRRGVLEQEAVGARGQRPTTCSSASKVVSTMTCGGSGRSCSARVASRPLIRGIRMSISTTSGRSSSTSAAPRGRRRPRRPPRGRAGRRASATSADRTSGSSSTTAAGSRMVMPPTGSSRAARSWSPSRGASSRPPRSSARSASPTRPSPDAGGRAAEAERVAHHHVEPVLGRPGELDGQQAAGGVLAGVGDPLLDDPVERPAGRVRHSAGARPGRGTRRGARSRGPRRPAR